MFEIKAIQAAHGDALFISYGDAARPHHILIDGGTTDTKANLVAVLEAARRKGRIRLEALVITHYDLDHINGIIALLDNKPEWLDIDDVWFNGKKHVRPKDVLGKNEGDELTRLISSKYSWNKAFEKGRICADDDIEPIDLAGMRIWVLSPDETRLASLGAEWTGEEPPGELDAEVEEDLLGRKDVWPLMDYSKFSPPKFKSDDSVPNGSSIALLLEYDKRRALLTGDAFASVVTASLKDRWKLPLEVSILKLSHHGSKANTNRELLNAIKCNRFLISSNGAIYKHPDQALIGLLVTACANTELIFNYRTPQTEGWESPPSDWPDYTTTFAADDEIFVSVSV